MVNDFLFLDGIRTLEIPDQYALTIASVLQSIVTLRIMSLNLS